MPLCRRVQRAQVISHRCPTEEDSNLAAVAAAMMVISRLVALALTDLHQCLRGLCAGFAEKGTKLRIALGSRLWPQLHPRRLEGALRILALTRGGKLQHQVEKEMTMGLRAPTVMAIMPAETARRGYLEMETTGALAAARQGGGIRTTAAGTRTS